MLWKCLHDILEIVEKEKFFENKSSFEYDLPDGKHHLFVCVDDSLGKDNLRVVVNVFEAHEPCGRGVCCFGDIGELLVECTWVIEGLMYY